MPYPINEDLLPIGEQTNRPGTLIKVRFLVAHRTGNTSPTANARMHRKYFGSGYRASSAHTFTDKDEILSIIPWEKNPECAWHAGKITSKTWEKGNPNLQSIGNELCECYPFMSPEGDAAYRKYVWLHAYQCKLYGLDPHQHIYGHFMIDPVDRPEDPKGYFNWSMFLDDVAAALAAMAPIPPPEPVPAQMPIIGQAEAAVGQAQAWARSRGATDTFIGLAPLYWQLAPQRGGVNPAGAYAQAAKETGFGRFGGVIDESYCNPCGMKTTTGGGNSDPSAHQRFASWEEGVAAHLDHLALYAGAKGYPRAGTPDPRHFVSIAGTAPTFEALGGKWAPSLDYGKSIVRDYLASLLAVQVEPPTNIDMLNRLAVLEEKVQEMQADLEQIAGIAAKYGG